MLITPDAEEDTTTLPEMVAQLDRAVASACELMVAVAWEQMAEVWARGTKSQLSSCLDC